MAGSAAATGPVAADMSRRWPVGWNGPAMAGAVAAVVGLLVGIIYAGQIADAVKRWRERQ